MELRAKFGVNWCNARMHFPFFQLLGNEHTLFTFLSACFMCLCWWRGCRVSSPMSSLFVMFVMW